MHHTTKKQLKSSTISSICFTAILLGASFYSQAEVYKWSDKHGNTHYSDIKPNDTQSKKIKIKTHQPTTPTTSPQTAAKELSNRQAEALKEKSEKLKTATEKRELNAKCEAIRSNLKTLQENSRIKVNDNGETRFLTPEEIAEKKQSYTEKLSEHCSN